MRQAIVVVLLLVAVCAPAASSADVNHGILFTKGCNGSTPIGQPYSCTYTVQNFVDDAGDTLSFDGLTDTVHAAGGNVSSGNVFSQLRLEIGTFLPGFSTAPYCTGGIGTGTALDPFRSAPGNPLISCTLPFGSRLNVQSFSFYTVQPADLGLVDHALKDDAELTWHDHCDDPAHTGNSNCVSNPTTIGAGSQTTVTGPPDLTITKTHTGNFTQGQSGNYTITVTNSGDGPTSGTITVTDPVPTGLIVQVLITGNDWNCTASTSAVMKCQRSSALAAGASASSITLRVGVASNAQSVTNTATVSGGGETDTTNDSASDPTTIAPPPPVTTIALSPPSPNGNSGWYKTSPTFTLNATDTGGPGIATTYYQIDGGTTQTYTGTPVSISDGSSQTVSYWSVDTVGTTETTHTTAPIKVDTVAPTIKAPASVTANAPTSAGTKVTYTVTFSDTGPSGLASSGCAPASGSVFKVGTTTVTCTAISVAGLTVTASFSVGVRTQDGNSQGQNHNQH
jgi:uncharacterized repeat protein (TIGR01451 family)